MVGLDVAGVVGTWVAASLALIALVGIVGPILIWRASRTERHQAIVAIGLHNYGYVSRGIPVWPGVRLAQRVRAPRIHKVRKFKDEEWSSFDTNRMAIGNGKSPDSPASWVSFGAFLGGHAVGFERDGDIVVREGIAFLPVSRAFLMTFALVGRFSSEQDRKRKIKGDGIRTWDRRGSRLLQADIELGNRRSFSRHGNQPEGQIHGLTGSLYFTKPDGMHVAGDAVKNSWSVVFVGESTQEPLEIPRDSISLEAIGMLSLGFLPFQDGYFVNVLDPLDEDDGKSEDSDESDDNQVGKGYTRRRSRRTADEDGDDNDDFSRRRGIPRTGTPVRFIDQIETPVTVIAYELLEIIVTEAEILEYFSTQENAKYLALYEMKLDGKTRSELREFSDQTFLPAAAPWVRLKGSPPKYGEPRTDCFIRREDAQRIAYSLLDILWHPEGYLIPGAADKSDRAKVMDLLCSISERTRPFLIRLKEGVSALDLSSRDEQAFLDAAESVIRRAALSPTRRALLNVLFAFDEFIKNLQHERMEVQQMVGILMLTNEEFTELVYQSARHMTASSETRVEFDLQAGTLKVPGTFGTMQTFELDVHVLYKQSLQLGARGKVSVKHSDILKAALRAYVRSLMLASCYDAEPLTECFEAITTDVLYMG